MFVRSLKFYLSAVLILMVFSCQPQYVPVEQPSTGDETDDDRRRGRGDGYSRTRGSRSEEARTRRHSCRNYGDQSDYKCKEDEDCIEACDELFPIKKYEDECLELPVELVYDFEELLLEIDEGQADDIQPQTLYCLLNIDDKEFLDEISGLSVRETKNFLQQIASDEDLAKVISEHDENYTILDSIMEGLSNADAPAFFAEEVTGDDISFLDLILDADNETAFGWVDGYIDEICQDNEGQCTGSGSSARAGDIFVAYCRIYRGKLTSTNRSWKILERSAIFKDQYEDFITNETCGSDSCDYDDVQDFIDVCENVYGVQESDGW